MIPRISSLTSIDVRARIISNDYMPGKEVHTIMTLSYNTFIDTRNA